MSLVVLKKKSRHSSRVAPISGRGTDGFSLNGGYRNIGSVGRFRLISNTTRTPFKGTKPTGNGGKLGKYYDSPLNSGSCLTNDNKMIKKSSLNNSGMIYTKNKWMHGQYPNWVVQPDDGHCDVEHTSGDYTRKKSISSIGNNLINVQNSGNCDTIQQNENETQYIYSCKGNSKSCSYFIGSTKHIVMPYAKNFNQPAMSQSQYLSAGGPLIKNCLPTPPEKQPFPIKISHNKPSFNRIGSVAVDNCQVNYSKWEDAYDAGILPVDWRPSQEAILTSTQQELIVNKTKEFIDNSPPTIYQQ